MMVVYKCRVLVKRTGMSTNAREVIVYETDDPSALTSWLSANITDPYTYEFVVT